MQSRAKRYWIIDFQKEMENIG